MENNVLTFEQGCKLLGYKKSYVYKLTHQGTIPFSKPNGKRIFFDKKELEAWILGNGNYIVKNNFYFKLTQKEGKTFYVDTNLDDDSIISLLKDTINQLTTTH
jgi:excisionase family DNA binding protein